MKVLPFKTGILGINARNLLYLRPYNRKNAIKLADNKLKTKRFLSERGIPVAKLYGTIENKEQFQKFQWKNLPKSFVIKPNRGFGGEGIKIIDQFDPNDQVRIQQIYEHIMNILEGNFSLANAPDFALLEQKIIPHQSLVDFIGEGLPDIRIIVHNLIPIMAMLRLPTPESGGIANLHAGGAIAGIDLASGEITHIYHHKKLVDNLPYAKKPLRGFVIPKWEEMLNIATRAQLISNLGYLAIDIVIDKNEQPLVLEMNARGGLGIQIANQAPLRERLERIKGLKVQTSEKGVRIGKEIFGSTIEREITQISGKIVIGLKEPIELLLGKEGTHIIVAIVDTVSEYNIMDRTLAEKLNLIEADEEEGTVKVDIVLGGKRIKTAFVVRDLKHNPDENKIILGKKILKDYLVDPSKKEEYYKSYKVDLITPSKRTDYPEIDRKLSFIDEKISLLKYIRPNNIPEEKEKFFANPETYNPQFTYPEIEFDKEHFTLLLQEISTDQTPLGQLFEKKKIELQTMLALLEAVDTEQFTELSTKLYGTIDDKLLHEARNRLEQLPIFIDKKEKNYSAIEVKAAFEKVLQKYGLTAWNVILSEKISSAASVGKSSKIFIRKDALFPASKLEGTIIHELETHVLTAENGKLQPYLLFNRGFGNYLLTQEGLAVYNQEEFTEFGTSNIKYYFTAANILAVYYATQFSFSKCFHLMKQFSLPDEDAFRLVMKAKRGFKNTAQAGAFTKGVIYLKGLLMIREFAAAGGDLTKLYIGKIAMEDIDSIYKIPTLRSPKYVPFFLQ